ncbi:hypothetical protein, partial [Bradyrhizobium brasilense]|uniref:hypothetical protein n=1 Tax=Bradyrhizobium brasilense TaxID=1419277 RepID=UPI001E53285E
PNGVSGVDPSGSGRGRRLSDSATGRRTAGASGNSKTFITVLRTGPQSQGGSGAPCVVPLWQES